MDYLYKRGHSQKLLHCNVTGKNYAGSERFIELEHYKLWSYMMFHKHSLKIGNVGLWLWLEEGYYKEREEFYSLALEVLEVNKLSILLFDERNGFSHITTRYAKVDETDKVKEILLSHISPERLSSDNFEVVVEKGFCIKNNTQDVEALVLGLSEKDDRFWYRER